MHWDWADVWEEWLFHIKMQVFCVFVTPLCMHTCVCVCVCVCACACVCMCVCVLDGEWNSVVASTSSRVLVQYVVVLLGSKGTNLKKKPHVLSNSRTRRHWNEKVLVCGSSTDGCVSDQLQWLTDQFLWTIFATVHTLLCWFEKCLAQSLVFILLSVHPVLTFSWFCWALALSVFLSQSEVKSVKQCCFCLLSW